MAKPLAGTLAEAYLHARGIMDLRGCPSLRFHPRCWYRPDEHAPTETWPAMIAVVTDLRGAITGVHRTWLAPDGLGKAPVSTPRRAMGSLKTRWQQCGPLCQPRETVSDNKWLTSVPVSLTRLNGAMSVRYKAPREARAFPGKFARELEALIGPQRSEL